MVSSTILNGVDPRILLQLVELEQQTQLKEKAKDDYLSYCIYSHGGINGLYKKNRHGEVICKAIQEAVEESDRLRKLAEDNLLTDEDAVVRLVISMPPQHGKSMTVAETLPSWFVGRNPDLKAHVVSYGGRFSVKFGRKNKEKIETVGKELFGIELEHGNKSITSYGIKGHVGGVNSVGIRGGITGEPGHLIIVDDPYKNMGEAQSHTIRQSVESMFESAIETRLHPGSLLIVVHTRWHEDDLIGFFSEKYKGRVKILNIPAECIDEETDPIGRKLGEYLWLKKGTKYYDDWKLTGKLWDAMFQQKPAPASGSLFKKREFRYYNKQIFYMTGTRQIDYSKFRYLVMSWDCAFEGKVTSDFVAGHIWGYYQGNYYLLHRYKERMDFVDSHSKILAVIRQFPAVKTKLIEAKANGHAIIQTLERRDNVKGIIGVSPKESKEIRAGKVAYLVNDGQVFLPEDDPTIDETVEEFGNFPYGSNDDEVDAAVQALSYIQEQLNVPQFFIGRA